jgi:hypothetical protein
LGIHPLTIPLIGHRHGRNFPYGYSGRFNNKTTQHGVLADRDVASAIFLPTGVVHGIKPIYKVGASAFANLLMSSISTINEITVVNPMPGTEVSNCIGSLKISLRYYSGLLQKYLTKADKLCHMQSQCFTPIFGGEPYFAQLYQKTPGPVACRVPG